jgi:hypothetical protein
MAQHLLLDADSLGAAGPCDPFAITQERQRLSDETKAPSQNDGVGTDAAVWQSVHGVGVSWVLIDEPTPTLCRFRSGEFRCRQ